MNVRDWWGKVVFATATAAGIGCGIAVNHLAGPLSAILATSTVEASILFVLFAKCLRRTVAQTDSVVSAISSGSATVVDDAMMSDSARHSALGQILVRLLQAGRELFHVMRAVGVSVNDIAIGSAEVSFFLDSLKKSIARQLEQATRISASAEELSATTTEVAKNAAYASKVASESRDTSEVGRNTVERMLGKFQEINVTAGRTGKSLRELHKQSKHIHSITEVINNVADQTNLLALNAAIEAARAGEHGRGFAVVADEVRELANQSAGATREIDSMLKKMGAITEQSVKMIGELEEEMKALVSGTIGVEQTFSEISSQVENAAKQAQQIVDVLNEQVKATCDISEAIHSVREELGTVEQDAGKAATDTFSLSERSEAVEVILAQYDLGTRHKAMVDAARGAASTVGKIFEAAVAAGEISMDDLFDRNYETIPGTNPPKYRTRFDGFTDRVLPAVQEPILDACPDAIFAGAVDSNGYFPTHNRKYSQALTGDYEKDLANSRTKRLFNDRTGSRCGTHTQPALLQTYKRDTGEVMHDVSTPIFVNGRHWGGFRIGYRASIETGDRSHFTEAADRKSAA